MPSDSRVERVLFRPDGRAILACSSQTARLWAVPTGKSLSAPITLGGYVEGIAFSPGGAMFATKSQFALAADDYRRAEQIAPTEGLRAWYEHREAMCRLAGQVEAAAWYRQLRASLASRGKP
jgi:hypothetical protein